MRFRTVTLFAAVALLLTSRGIAQSAAVALPGGTTDRESWVNWVDRIAGPVLEAGAVGQLRARLPVAPGTEQRARFAVLEAVGRLLCGIAPWLESDARVPEAESKLREKYRGLAVKTIASLVDPASADAVDFEAGPQILVDSAFLAEAFLRAPRQLWGALPTASQQRLLDRLELTRKILPGPNNWLLFAAEVETFLKSAGRNWDVMRVDYALRQHDQWYKGDGFYGDGAEYHFDYYNSLVIQPMLLEVLASAGPDSTWAKAGWPGKMLLRAQRHAAVLERLISPEGAVPPVGRSLAYRCGMLHGLSQLAFRRQLPASLPPAQVRSAMSAAIQRFLSAPGTFDTNGWLTIGFAGAQPAIGETYISTGSVYLCSAAFLPLGLPPEDPFWSGAATPWTSRRVYAGENVGVDHALHE